MTTDSLLTNSRSSTDSVLVSDKNTDNDSTSLKHLDRLSLLKEGSVERYDESDKVTDEFGDLTLVSDDTKPDILEDPNTIKEILKGIDFEKEMTNLSNDVDNGVLGTDSRIFLEKLFENLNSIDGVEPKHIQNLMMSIVGQTYLGMTNQNNSINFMVQPDGNFHEYWMHVYGSDNEAIENEFNIQAHMESARVARILVYDNNKSK